MTTVPVYKLSLANLRAQAMQLAGNRGPEDGSTYSRVIKAIASRTKQPARKIRRQARTGFWATC